MPDEELYSGDLPAFNALASADDAQHMERFVTDLAELDSAARLGDKGQTSEGLDNAYPVDLHLGASSNVGVLEQQSLEGTAKAQGGQQGDMTMFSQVVLSVWTADFPPPSDVFPLLLVFFDKCDYLKFMIQQRRFFEEVAQGPHSPQYPTHALLHSIFALAYRLCSSLDLPSANNGGPNALSKDHDTLSRFHRERARHHIFRPRNESKHLLSCCKAAIILANTEYGLGNSFDAWVLSGMATKIAISLNLNKGVPDLERMRGKLGFPIDLDIPSLMITSPSDWVDAEERRRVMILAFITWVTFPIWHRVEYH